MMVAFLIFQLVIPVLLVICILWLRKNGAMLKGKAGVKMITKIL